MALAGTAYYLHRTARTDPGAVHPPSNPANTIMKLADEDDLTGRSFCSTCLTRKPLRSKHCRVCHRCVVRFDHHCPWTSNCIGQDNHRLFMLYLYSLLTAGWLYAYLGWCVIGKDYNNSVLMLASLPQRMNRILLMRQLHPLLFGMISLLSLTMAMLTGLVLYQSRLIASNETTNEVSNVGRLEYLTDPTSGHYHNPFHRGPLRNCAEFWQRGVDYSGLFSIAYARPLQCCKEKDGSIVQV